MAQNRDFYQGVNVASNPIQFGLNVQHDSGKGPTQNVTKYMTDRIKSPNISSYSRLHSKSIYGEGVATVQSSTDPSGTLATNTYPNSTSKNGNSLRYLNYNQCSSNFTNNVTSLDCSTKDSRLPDSEQHSDSSSSTPTRQDDLWSTIKKSPLRKTPKLSDIPWQQALNVQNPRPALENTSSNMLDFKPIDRSQIKGSPKDGYESPPVFDQIPPNSQTKTWPRLLSSHLMENADFDVCQTNSNFKQRKTSNNVYSPNWFQSDSVFGTPEQLLERKISGRSNHSGSQSQHLNEADTPNYTTKEAPKYFEKSRKISDILKIDLEPQKDAQKDVPNLRRRHNSLPDFIHSYENVIDKEVSLSSERRKKTELASSVSISKTPVHDLAQALREDVEKLNSFRSRHRQINDDIDPKEGKNFRSIGLIRSRSFGAIEHNYASKNRKHDDEFFASPRVLPRSSSKEAVHRLAKLYGFSLQSEEEGKERINLKPKPGKNLVSNTLPTKINKANKTNFETQDINQTETPPARPPPPKKYIEPLKRVRALSESYLKDENFKEAFEKYNTNFLFGPQIELQSSSVVDKDSSRIQDSDLEVEALSTHSSISGVSTVSLLDTPNSNFSAASSQQSSLPDHTLASQNSGDVPNSPLSQFSLYEGDSSSMDWINKNLEALNSHARKNQERRNNSGDSSGLKKELRDKIFQNPGTKILQNSRNDNSPRSADTLARSFTFQRSRDPVFYGSKDTYNRNFAPSHMFHDRNGLRHSYQNSFATQDRSESDDQNSVRNFALSEQFLNRLRETDILGNSFEDLTSCQSNLTQGLQDVKLQKEKEPNSNATSLANGANTLPRAVQIQDCNIDSSHSHYVETLRNLAPIWLVNPGGHPKPPKNKSPLQRSLSTNTAASQSYERLKNPKQPQRSQLVPSRQQSTSFVRPLKEHDTIPYPNDCQYEIFDDTNGLRDAPQVEAFKQPSDFSSKNFGFSLSTSNIYQLKPNTPERKPQYPYCNVVIPPRSSSTKTVNTLVEFKPAPPTKIQNFAPKLDTKPDMSDAWAELDAAMNSLQNLAMAPIPAMKTFGKSNDITSPTQPKMTNQEKFGQFNPSTRISTNYPQFPSNQKSTFEPKMNSSFTSSNGSLTSQNLKTQNISNSLDEFKPDSFSSRQSRRPENLTNGPIPLRSRSFLRSGKLSSEQQNLHFPSKRSGSQEPSVFSPTSPVNDFEITFASKPSQIITDMEKMDNGGADQLDLSSDRSLKQLSIITNQNNQNSGKEIQNKALNTFQYPFSPPKIGGIMGAIDADYSNNTLPHQKNGSSLSINYHNVSQNFLKSPSPLSPNGAGDIYYPPSSPDVNQVAITCEETSKLWYRAKMSREDIAMALSRLPVGSFIIRDSTSYPGYYGLAIKTDNSGVNGTMMTADSIRHFLIETSVRGARIKGSPAEPHYKSLADLVEQHTSNPISLPCKLVLPNPKLLNSVSSPTQRSLSPHGYPGDQQANNHKSVTSPNPGNFHNRQHSTSHAPVTVATVPQSNLSPTSPQDDIMKLQLMNTNLSSPKMRASSNTSLNSQHTTSSLSPSPNSSNSQMSAACLVLYIGCYDVELLSGVTALNRAMTSLLEDEQKLLSKNGKLQHLMNPGSPQQPEPTISVSNLTTVHFKIDQKSVTITDMSRKVFFRKCLSLQALLFCGVPTATALKVVKTQVEGKDHFKRVFGLVTKKDGQMSSKTNQCWLFTEYEDDQPVSAIINFVRKLTSHFVSFPAMATSPIGSPTAFSTDN